MERPDSNYYTTWADALKHYYALPNTAVAPMNIAHEESAYNTITHKPFTCKATATSTRNTLLLSSSSSQVSCLPSPPPPSTSKSDSSSSTSSEEGAGFLFGWAESRKERRHANRELKKNTRLNNGMYKVKERLNIFREEEEFGFCFGWDSDGERCESEDEVDEEGCASCLDGMIEVDEVDEEVFDGGERVGSEDSDSLCDDDEEEEEGSSVAQDDEMGDDDEEMEAGGDKDGEGSDEEMEDGGGQGKERKRKRKKSVSWKADDELAEIHIVQREDLSMTYVFGQERAMMMKEDGTSKFASKKATSDKASATEPTTEKTTRVGLQRISSNEEPEPYVFGRQQAVARQADQQRSDSPQKEAVVSNQQHTISKDTEANDITIVQTTKEEQPFVFGRHSKARKNEPKHIARIIITEVEPESVASEPEEAFVFGKQPGVWRKSRNDMDTD